MPWLPPDLPTDPDEVIARLLDAMTARLDGWVPVEGDPMVVLIEELGREMAVLNAAAIDAFDMAIAGIAETVFGFPAVVGTPATVEVTLSMTSAPGAVLPAGFTVVGTNPDGEEVAFVTLADAISAGPGTSLVVEMTATVDGSVGNDITVGELTMVTATTAVAAATIATTSAGGTDDEDVDDYLDRFADWVATLRPGGVTAADVAALARSVPGVHRALGVNLYDPTDPGTPSERTVTVVCLDEDSNPVASPIAAQVQAVIEAAREVNFVVHTTTPTYTPVTIVIDAVAETGHDPAVVDAAITGAVADWLTHWGISTTDASAWVDKPTLRFLELARIAGSVAGVAYLTAVTVNGGADDVALAGPASMPARLDAGSPSTITVTVS